jgi:hypothetical protein
MNTIFKSSALIFSLAILITAGMISCNKDDGDDTDDLNAVYNNAASETAYNDVASIGDESVIDEDLSSFKMDDAEKISAPCIGPGTLGSITKDSSGTPWTTTIDFGPNNCLCNDGKNRRGKIIINHPPTDAARDSGAVFHHTFDEHFVNDNKVLGFIDVQNHGLSPEGFPHFKWDVEGELELANGEGTITWESHQVKAYLAGFETPSRLDDKIGIHGSSSGVTQTGETFTAEIDSLLPLRQRFSVGCRKHFFAGTAYVTPQGKPMRTINYGEVNPEVCDDIAIVTVNGQTYTINLDDTHE